MKNECSCENMNSEWLWTS